MNIPLGNWLNPFSKRSINPDDVKKDRMLHHGETLLLRLKMFGIHTESSNKNYTLTQFLALRSPLAWIGAEI